jgi:hypothetical protein
MGFDVSRTPAPSSAATRVHRALGGFAASAAPQSTLCRAARNWGSATSSCPAGPRIRYDIYRSTTPVDLVEFRVD